MTGRRRAESVPLRAAGSAAPSPARPPPPALAEVAEVAEAPREGSPPGGLPQHEEGARSPAARQNAGEWLPPKCRVLHAVMLGRANEVDELLRSGEDPDEKNLRGERAVHAAARLGRKRVLEALANGGACDLDAPNANGETAVILAASAGQAGCVQALLAAGADPNCVDGRGDTALHRGAKLGHAKAVEALIVGKASPATHNTREQTPLQNAAQQGHVDVIVTMLQMKTSDRQGGPDGDSGDGGGGGGDDGEADGATGTAVAAALARSVGAAAVLTGLDERDFLGRSALDMALAEGHTQAAATLMMAGAATSTDTLLRSPPDLLANVDAGALIACLVRDSPNISEAALMLSARLSGHMPQLDRASPTPDLVGSELAAEHTKQTREKRCQLLEELACVIVGASETRARAMALSALRSARAVDDLRRISAALHQTDPSEVVARLLESQGGHKLSAVSRHTVLDTALAFERRAFITHPSVVQYIDSMWALGRGGLRSSELQEGGRDIDGRGSLSSPGAREDLLEIMAKRRNTRRRASDALLEAASLKLDRGWIHRMLGRARNLLTHQTNEFLKARLAPLRTPRAKFFVWQLQYLGFLMLLAQLRSVGASGSDDLAGRVTHYWLDLLLLVWLFALIISEVEVFVAHARRGGWDEVSEAEGDNISPRSGELTRESDDGVSPLSPAARAYMREKMARRDRRLWRSISVSKSLRLFRSDAFHIFGVVVLGLAVVGCCVRAYALTYPHDEGLADVERYVRACLVVLLWLLLLRAFSAFGQSYGLLLTATTAMLSDVMQWVILMVLFLLGWAQGFVVVFANEPGELGAAFSNFGDGVVTLATLLMGMDGGTDSPLAALVADSSSPALGSALLLSFSLVTIVLLLNLLIAMFSLSFQAVQESADDAHTILRAQIAMNANELAAVPPPLNLFSNAWHCMLQASRLALALLPGLDSAKARPLRRVSRYATTHRAWRRSISGDPWESSALGLGLFSRAELLEHVLEQLEADGLLTTGSVIAAEGVKHAGLLGSRERPISRQCSRNRAMSAPYQFSEHEEGPPSRGSTIRSGDVDGFTSDGDEDDSWWLALEQTRDLRRSVKLSRANSKSRSGIRFSRSNSRGRGGVGRRDSFSSQGSGWSGHSLYSPHQSARGSRMLTRQGSFVISPRDATERSEPPGPISFRPSRVSSRHGSIVAIPVAPVEEAGTLDADSAEREPGLVEEAGTLDADSAEREPGLVEEAAGDQAAAVGGEQPAELDAAGQETAPSAAPGNLPRTSTGKERARKQYAG